MIWICLKPEAQALNKSKEDNLTISISKEGFYSLDIGEKIRSIKALNHLKNNLKILINNPKVEIFLRADKETLYDNVAQIMSLIKNLKQTQ